MDKPKKRMGRPTQPPVEGERVSLGFRVTAEVKRKLEAAAVASGRSISQEAELRIERSFAADSIEQTIREEGRAQRKAIAAAMEKWTSDAGRDGRLRTIIDELFLSEDQPTWWPEITGRDKRPELTRRGRTK